MTAQEIYDRLAGMGVSVSVRDGKPAFVGSGGKLNARQDAAVRESVAGLTPTTRSELLELFGCDLWDGGWAVRRMEAADGAVAAAGGVGLVPAVWSAAGQVCHCYRERDRGGVEEWCRQVEELAREHRRKSP